MNDNWRKVPDAQLRRTPDNAEEDKPLTATDMVARNAEFADRMLQAEQERIENRRQSRPQVISAEDIVANSNVDVMRRALESDCIHTAAAIADEMAAENGLSFDEKGNVVPLPANDLATSKATITDKGARIAELADIAGARLVPNRTRVREQSVVFTVPEWQEFVVRLIRDGQ